MLPQPPCLRLVLLTLCLCLSPARAADLLPGFEQVRAAWRPSDAVLLDRQGVPLADLRLDPQGRRLGWVSLQSLSPAMREALLAAEDKRFFEHSGIDWKAFLGAAWQNLWSKTRRGASTLTMQLAGLLDPALQLPGQGTARRSLGQKWDQSLAALELERRWSKAQILEAYLNLAPSRGDLVGLGAASELLFGLPPAAVTRREAVILAALLRGPNARPALVARRACALAAVLEDRRLCASITQLAHARLDAPRNRPRYTLAPHLARQWLRQVGELRSSLDARLQGSLLAAMGRQPTPAWALLLDNASGEVRAWVVTGLPAGAPDPLLQPLRLPGWWAPHAAGATIAARTHTAASLLIDPDTVLDAQDARSGHRTAILSLRSALLAQRSGALRGALRDLDEASLAAWAQDTGADLRADALSAERSPAQVAAAWRSLMSAMSFVPATGLPASVPSQPQAARSDTAFIVQDMLAHEGRSLWAMQTTDGRTGLVVGHSARYTLLLGDSGDGAAREARWQALLASVDEAPPAPPAVPEGVVSQVVYFEPPGEAPRREWFLRGTAHSPFMADALPHAGRILWPSPGASHPQGSTGSAPWALLAACNRACRWLLDGQPLGSGPRIGWSPQPGTHRLQLIGPQGEVLDALRFEVTP